ncbi:helix-turn-helix domain-containing protein [Amycolatopsis sp. CA-230715]|uniref:helix-turn-helix domain-containing protein n=1 Tax=Amycolatopsis sp. CA-230715 TaxID=2745196 RepID=UPI001C022B69|nr:helix-turn-helix domain-containing protein [Amycolatopsis sp. CA-230715]QWF82913.1 hypothetical protein HUW46_06352 [Amycolatopsis sp. CA-230715]
MELHAEFTSEPFRGEGPPPEHAVLACEAAERAGLRTDFGPLGTAADGEHDAVLDALPSIVRAALDGGATQVTLRLNTGDAPRPASTGDPNVLGGFIRAVEAELGARLGDLDRPGKQRAVRLLEERGAFQLRKSVATVAEALGVTRFTVYNYLHRDES